MAPLLLVAPGPQVARGIPRMNLAFEVTLPLASRLHHLGSAAAFVDLRRNSPQVGDIGGNRFWIAQLFHHLRPADLAVSVTEGALQNIIPIRHSNPRGSADVHDAVYKRHYKARQKKSL